MADRKQQYCVMKWTTDGNRVSTHHLKYISEPKLDFDEYEVGDEGTAAYPGYAGKWSFVILAIGETKVEMDEWLEGYLEKDKPPQKAVERKKTSKKVGCAPAVHSHRSSAEKAETLSAGKYMTKKSSKTNTYDDSTAGISTLPVSNTERNSPQVDRSVTSDKGYSPTRMRSVSSSSSESFNSMNKTSATPTEMFATPTKRKNPPTKRSEKTVTQTKRKITPIKMFADRTGTPPPTTSTPKRKITPTKRFSPRKMFVASTDQTGTPTPTRSTPKRNEDVPSSEINFLKEEIYKLKRKVRKLEDWKREMESVSSAAEAPSTSTDQRRELLQLVGYESQPFKAAKVLLHKLFTVEELLTHSVSGKAANSKVKAKPKFNQTKFSLFESIMREKFPTLEGKELTAKIQAVQKNALRDQSKKE